MKFSRQTMQLLNLQILSLQFSTCPSNREALDVTWTYSVLEYCTLSLVCHLDSVKHHFSLTLSVSLAPSNCGSVPLSRHMSCISRPRPVTHTYITSKYIAKKRVPLKANIIFALIIPALGIYQRFHIFVRSLILSF